MGQLDLDCLFLHADQTVYCKLMMIKWLNEGKENSGQRIFILNEEQTMPQNTNDWNNFLNNGENKIELINFFLTHFSTQKIRSRFKVKLLFTEFKNT